MAATYHRLVRHTLTGEDAQELDVVDGLADQLRAHIEVSADEIDRVHIHGAQSRAVQDIVATLLTQEGQGFVSEHRLVAGDLPSPAARPDFFYDLGQRRGIFVEVERGGTTANNHDLKDMWKTHLAEYAHHLFLVVPYTNWDAHGNRRGSPFESSRRRLAVFFGDERREVDVLSVHLFAYGRTS